MFTPIRLQQFNEPSCTSILRTMPPSLTHHRRGATLHDKIIATAFHRILGSESGSLAQRERALRQARLPVNLGGMGLTSAVLPGIPEDCRNEDDGHHDAEVTGL